MRTGFRLITMLVLLGPGRVLAIQDQGFVPLSEAAPRETLPATPLVFGAYAFCWAALLVYVFMLWRRLGRMQRDLAEVAARTRTGA